MTDSDYTHYVGIIDRTGSMQKIRADTEGGFNQFVEDQKKLPGRATLSLYQFDSWHAASDGIGRGSGQYVTQVETVASFLPLGDVRPYKLNPRGNTPLLDAVGAVVTETGEKLAAMPEDKRPGQVIVIIATDGGENCSHEWTKDTVKALTTQQQEDYGWKFTYIGANQDAFAEAGGMGIPMAASMGYAASPGGTRNAWGRMSANVSRSRAGGQSVGIAYSDEDRAAAEEK